MNDTITYLEALSNAHGVSGAETQVRRVIRSLVQEHVDGLEVDAVGNLITWKSGTGASRLRVLVAAHMDEVGFMVVGHTNDGALRFETVGGIPARILPGLTVLVGPDALPGVIGIQAIHRLKKKERTSRVPTVSDLVIDVGACNKEEAQRLAPVGTTAVFATQFQQTDTSCIGKAFDDRAGCATLVSLLQAPRFPFDLFGVFTVQEEVGLRGAQVAAYRIKPDAGVTLEGTLADDLPKEDSDVSPTTSLGQGPAITVMDRSYITPPRLLQHFTQVAEREELPYQFKQPGIGGTDSGGIHRAGKGVPTITVAVPCRYIHSPASILRKHDLNAWGQLVDAALRSLTPDVLTLRLSE